MPRIFFQRAPSCFRTVQGEVIKKMQQELISDGFLHYKDDGVFGGDTEVSLNGVISPQEN